MFRYSLLSTLVVISFLFLSTSCQNPASTDGGKKVAAVTKILPKKNKVKNANKTISKENRDRYYNDLKTALKLKTKDIKAVRTIDTKYRKQLAELRKNKTLDAIKRKELKKSQKEEIRAALGGKTFKMKLSFDKTWK